MLDVAHASSPRAGARIETSYRSAHAVSSSAVAPRAGARIETLGRMVSVMVANVGRVAPRAGARIETDLQLMVKSSPPVRGRGLKRSPWATNYGTIMSPPVRGRGLKQDQFVTRRSRPADKRVAPRAGARIETPVISEDVATRLVAPRAGARIETISIKGSAHIRVEIQQKDPFLSGPGHDRGRTGRRE